MSSATEAATEAVTEAADRGLEPLGNGRPSLLRDCLSLEAVEAWGLVVPVASFSAFVEDVPLADLAAAAAFFRRLGIHSGAEGGATRPEPLAWPCTRGLCAATRAGTRGGEGLGDATMGSTIVGRMEVSGSGGLHVTG